MSETSGAAEQKLRDRILEKHRSVRAFAATLGVPCSTINNVLRRGVASVNLSTAGMLCDALELELSAFVRGEVEPARRVHNEPWEQELLEDCRTLDSHGRELVELVARKERERCAGQVVAFPEPPQAESWQQYVGVPIACRGGGVIQATEEDARQMEQIYRKLLK